MKVFIPQTRVLTIPQKSETEGGVGTEEVETWPRLLEPLEGAGGRGSFLAPLVPPSVRGTGSQTAGGRGRWVLTVGKDVGNPRWTGT